jgi:hypothetical protein
VELELVRSELLYEAENHVLVDSGFGLQPRDESAQGLLAAVKVSQLSKFTARLCRLVAKARDLSLLLARRSTKPGKLPVDRRRILRHELKVTKARRPALGNDAKCKTDAVKPNAFPRSNLAHARSLAFRLLP